MGFPQFWHKSFSRKRPTPALMESFLSFSCFLQISHLMTYIFPLYPPSNQSQKSVNTWCLHQVLTCRHRINDQQVIPQKSSWKLARIVLAKLNEFPLRKSWNSYSQFGWLLLLDLRGGIENFDTQNFSAPIKINQ